MFASNITARSRFHGPVPYAEACALWYCTRAYTIVRAAFIRFSVHFINAHRVYGSRRRQSGNHNALVHDYNGLASLLSRNCSAMRTKSFRPVIPALLSINSVDRLRSKRASSSLNSKELVFDEKSTSMIFISFRTRMLFRLS